jgi:hypothetical protein
MLTGTVAEKQSGSEPAPGEARLSTATSVTMMQLYKPAGWRLARLRKPFLPFESIGRMATQISSVRLGVAMVAVVADAGTIVFASILVAPST